MTESNGTSNLLEGICDGCSHVVENNCGCYANTSIWKRLGSCPLNQKGRSELVAKINPLKASKRARRGR